MNSTIIFILVALYIFVIIIDRPKTSKIERLLKEKYLPVFENTLGPFPSERIVFRCKVHDASHYFYILFNKAKKESKKGKTGNLPQNYGDILLKNEKTKKEIYKWIAKKRSEGVQDDDIRWWWNMHDYERKLIIAEEFNKDMINTTNILREPYKNLDLVFKEIRRRRRQLSPIYGDPDDTPYTKGVNSLHYYDGPIKEDDHPLPNELRNRINLFVEKQHNNLKEYKENIKNSSSFNALVRNEIRKGKI